MKTAQHMVQSHLSICQCVSGPQRGGWTCIPLLLLKKQISPVFSPVCQEKKKKKHSQFNGWGSHQISELLLELLDKVFIPGQPSPSPSTLTQSVNKRRFLSPSLLLLLLRVKLQLLLLFKRPHWQGLTLLRFAGANKAHKGLPRWPYQLGFIRCCAAPASTGAAHRRANQQQHMVRRGVKPAPMRANPAHTRSAARTKPGLVARTT